MKTRTQGAILAFASFGLLAAAASCGSSDKAAAPPPSGPVGQQCTATSQCFPGVADGGLMGAPTCLTQATGGYCTHLCTVDTDCCALAGECPDHRPEVCGPFTSAPDMYCLLSCEDMDLADAGVVDPNVYCQTYANPTFVCRSSGGGAANRKICAP